MDKFKHTLIYKRFEQIAGDNRKNIEDHLKKAAAELKLIRDTFPTYTLHDEVHAVNVIHIMGKLLNDKVEELTALECAMLMLSAYYHDIGMVYNEKERNEITNEPEFYDFLDEKKEAELEVKKHEKLRPENKGKVPDKVAEWYCRWVHPVRSSYKIKKGEDILWDGYRINEELAVICKSHGEDLGKHRQWMEENNDFNKGADLCLCAILLRLADILDFDDSRTPEPIYRYLELEDAETDSEKTSRKEWRKHGSSQGFIYTSKDDDFTLKFVATIEDPKIEYDIREFLDMIEKELITCNKFKRCCSDKWRNIFIPGEIIKSEIKSKGYHYGGYRFTLEQNQVMDLLMGENLYSDNYAFIRELAQNAIDTTRHRIIYEKNRGNNSFEPSPITFSSWADNDGYRWIRVDDYGMGMNAKLILNYFLKIGKSYYRSTEFEIEQQEWTEEDKNFTPISRFGIGILSCFIMGDRIELSTRRVTDRPERNAIRLSMEGLEGFFVMKKEEDSHTPSPMPHEKDTVGKYRNNREYGTSIAIRLNPRKERSGFDLKKILEKYIKVAPVPVEFEEERIGGDYDKLILQPWCEYKEFPISKEDIKKIEKALKMKFTVPPVIEQIPLDLTANSPSENFKGQGVIYRVKLGEEDMKTLAEEDLVSREIEIRSAYDKKGKNTGLEILFQCITIEKETRRKKDEKNHSLLFSDILEELPIFTAPDNHLFSSSTISHNGVSIPVSSSIELGIPKYGYILYKLSFKDNLRFNLSVSRDRIRNIDWGIYSIINYTCIRTLKRAKLFKSLFDWTVFRRYEIFHFANTTLKSVTEDQLILSNDNWRSLNIFLQNNGEFKSIKELKQKGEIIDIPQIRIYRKNEFLRFCKRALIQLELDIELDTDTMKTTVVSENTPVLEEWQKYYTPLYFIKYKSNEIFRKGDFSINQNHPLSQWLIKNTENLDKTYPALLADLIELCNRKLYTNDEERKEISIKHIVDKVNQILKRLKELKYSDTPKKSIYLKREDFVD